MATSDSRIGALLEKANQLPLSPGVYLMQDKNGTVIYVGKAKRLKSRVTSYFRALHSHTPKVAAMVDHVSTFYTIMTDSEFEALVLECSLIKQYAPKYNILLKDDKGYHYIHISKEDYPRIRAVKQKEEHGPGQLIGPYTSSFIVTQTVEEVGRIFQLPTCNRRFPQEFRKGRPCLNYHIKQCMGVCTGKISRSVYDEAIQSAVGFIRGNDAGITQRLEQEMSTAAAAMDFEAAARYRDRIRAIQRVAERQKVFFVGVDDCDILAFTQNGATVAVVVMRYRGERLCDKQDFMLEADSPLPEVRSEFLRRYYDDCEDMPKSVMLDGDCEDEELLSTLLSQLAGRKVVLTHPQRGQKNKLIELCRENAAQLLSHSLKPSGREVSLLDELAKLLGLRTLPQYIEAYDISNIGGSTIVGGMTVFLDTHPLRRAYKKFTIKTLSGTPDDYAAMQEMLTRRFTRLLEAESAKADADPAPADTPAQGEAADTPAGKPLEAPPEGFARRPDVVLIDGGAGHLTAARAVLDALGLSIPVFGMVKDQSHRTRALVGAQGEITIAPYKSLFALITKIQDETHRFTISFSRERHKTSALQSLLETVPGIGEKRRQALFLRFKTLKAIREADEATLSETPGITAKAAEALYRALHPQDETEHP